MMSQQKKHERNMFLLAKTLFISPLPIQRPLTLTPTARSGCGLYSPQQSRRALISLSHIFIKIQKWVIGKLQTTDERLQSTTSSFFCSLERSSTAVPRQVSVSKDGDLYHSVSTR
jgi:hypothetical protein